MDELEHADLMVANRQSVPRGQALFHHGDAFQSVTVSTLEGAAKARGARGVAKLTCVYEKRSGQAQVLELQPRR